jgi:hypothetical protein
MPILGAGGAGSTVKIYGAVGSQRRHPGNRTADAVTGIFSIQVTASGGYDQELLCNRDGYGRERLRGFFRHQLHPFHPAHHRALSVPPGSISGIITITYSVQQPASSPAQILVEVDERLGR